MCGRICLSLAPNEIQCACKYKVKASNGDVNTVDKTVGESSVINDHCSDNDKNCLKPEWRSEYNCGKKYQPSFNITPSSVTPVLVSTKHFTNKNKFNSKDDKISENDQQTCMLVPMMWGIIPFWHKGDYRKHGLTTNNCRLEHMLESKLYRRPFHKGQRCVVICEGYYEWQTTKSAKPSERSVYYIHMPQSDGVKIYEKSTWKDDMTNIKLLKMAALFDVWQDENGNKIYSYSIITHESSSTLSWLHHRMPAILTTDEQVANWLDFDRISDDKALSVLGIAPKLSLYQISSIVNKPTNQTVKCCEPIDYVKNNSRGGVVPKSKIMQSWLNIRKRKEDTLKRKFADSDDEDNNDDADVDDDNDERKTKHRKTCRKSESSETESGSEVLKEVATKKKIIMENQ